MQDSTSKWWKTEITALFKPVSSPVSHTGDVCLLILHKQLNEPKWRLTHTNTHQDCRPENHQILTMTECVKRASLQLRNTLASVLNVDIQLFPRHKGQLHFRDCPIQEKKKLHYKTDCSGCKMWLVEPSERTS